MKKSIHIFNPETDYALTCGRAQYSPPAAIRRLRKDMALFPATYAHPGDVILTLDVLDRDTLSSLQYHDIAEEKKCEIITPPEVKNFLDTNPEDDFRIEPWGWNHTLRRTLISMGFREGYLKSESDIDTLRRLSHRRTSIALNTHLMTLLPELMIELPIEISDLGKALEFASCRESAFFKAPWSSSGRGLVSTDSLHGESLSKWISGCIRRQGSVLAETGKKRTVDFATEWDCHDGVADFLGLSMFQTSPQGRYIRNEKIPQAEMHRRVRQASQLWGNHIIEAQKDAIEAIVAPHYSGPVGIDMFTTDSGLIVPCVEINLRHTMGMAALSQ